MSTGNSCTLISGTRGMNWHNLSGVYVITCEVNSKVYVGSSKNISKRITSHKNNLLKGSHHSIALQSAVNKYGIDAFSVSILEICEPYELQNTEQKYIDHYQSFKRNKGYNIARLAYVGTLGYVHTSESKRKISEASERMWAENRDKLIESLKNRVISDQTREKIRLANQKFNFPYEYLDYLYNEMNLKKSEISEILGVKERTLKDNLKRLGIFKKPENFTKLMDRIRVENPSPLKGIKHTQERIKKRSKSVIQMDLCGNFIAEFDGGKQAEKATGVFQSNISRVCKGVCSQAGGYKWEFKK